MLFLNDWIFNGPGNVCTGGQGPPPPSPGHLERTHSGARRVALSLLTCGSARRWGAPEPCELCDIRHTGGMFREDCSCIMSQWLCEHHITFCCFRGHGNIYKRWFRVREGTERPGYLHQDLGIGPGSNPDPPNDRGSFSFQFFKLTLERMEGRLPAPPSALSYRKSVLWDSFKKYSVLKHKLWLLLVK